MSEYSPIVKTKRSSVPYKVPAPEDLSVGQIAINFPDKKIYTKDGNNNIINLSDTGQVVDASVDDEKIVLITTPESEDNININFSEIDHNLLKNYNELEHHKLEFKSDLKSYFITDKTL